MELLIDKYKIVVDYKSLSRTQREGLCIQLALQGAYPAEIEKFTGIPRCTVSRLVSKPTQNETNVSKPTQNETNVSKPTDSNLPPQFGLYRGTPSPFTQFQIDEINRLCCTDSWDGTPKDEFLYFLGVLRFRTLFTFHDTELSEEDNVYKLSEKEMKKLISNISYKEDIREAEWEMSDLFWQKRGTKKFCKCDIEDTRQNIQIIEDLRQKFGQIDFGPRYVYFAPTL